MNSISEITLNDLIGLKFNLFKIKSIEIDFKSLYKRFHSDEIKLIESVIPLKLLVVKAGVLDLTFERSNSFKERYLRVFMTTNDIGPSFFQTTSNLDFDNFIENWNTSFDEFGKPIKFSIIDACYSNIDYVWDDKYFYG